MRESKASAVDAMQRPVRATSLHLIQTGLQRFTGMAATSFFIHPLPSLIVISRPLQQCPSWLRNTSVALDGHCRQLEDVVDSACKSAFILQQHEWRAFSSHRRLKSSSSSSSNPSFALAAGIFVLHPSSPAQAEAPHEELAKFHRWETRALAPLATHLRASIDCQFAAVSDMHKIAGVYGHPRSFSKWAGDGALQTHPNAAAVKKSPTSSR